MNNKIKTLFAPRAAVYHWIILILLAVIAYFDYRFALPGLAVWLLLLFSNWRYKRKRNKELARYIESLTLSVESASKDTLLNFPLPLLVVGLDGNIIWYNSQSRNVFGDTKLYDRNIAELLGGMKPDELIGNERISHTAEINYRHFRVLGNVMKTEARSELGEFILLLYFVDTTEQVQLKEKLEGARTVAGLVVIDNYEDLMQSVDDASKPLIMAEIEKKVNAWMGFTEGILKKFERDRFLFLFEAKYLPELIKNKFSVLDDVKTLKYGRIPVTLSIGFGINANDMEENLKYAEAAIDIALARGGDQAVIKDRESLNFYGGRTKELEKRTKVKARVVAYALRELIDRSSRVIIMGHENGDLDSLGASLGINALAKSRGKKSNIVLTKSNPNISRMLDRLKDNSEYDELFLKEGDALDLMDEKSLLIVLDTHRPSFTEAPRLLDVAKQVVVLDHHRRGAEFIEDPVLIYQETYASSTSELVTEILQYVDDVIKLTPEELEGLYAGIIVDTRNFTFKTGVRTFEAASYLRRKGVDTTSVKYLMQNDLGTYSLVADVVKDAFVINDTVAVSTVPENYKNQTLIAAKAADELLTLTGIDAAFVLCYSNGDIAISGRSLGELNVQAILEQLGGGGHMTVAGAQLEGVTIDEALKQLKYVIIKYMEERAESKKS